MTNTEMLIMIGSVFLGFLCMMAGFASFMYKKSLRQVWTLVAFAFLFLTIIPVALAIGWGTQWLH
ncbi:hypothetical protein [Corynebacterium epidermidicanis]|uniref:Uncharacterized protein n=1 Tax=Corynebacterium epidermidicanis TaxID=1050174 RepID=A0A0G3GZJ6_9CORY|nr:hypothetical protein [Corynebacterium epidermidicanis]AKK04232.1 hypothetical protein CEPID_12045 [Corynebacterium epidermidicanis]